MVLSSRVAAKYRGLSEGGGGAALLSADNTPPRNPFIIVPVTLRNCVTIRVGGDDVTVRVLTVTGAFVPHRHSVTAVTHRHASLAISFKLMLRPV